LRYGYEDQGQIFPKDLKKTPEEAEAAWEKIKRVSLPDGGDLGRGKK
jgi:hypothetical protein